MDKIIITPTRPLTELEYFNKKIICNGEINIKNVTSFTNCHFILNKKSKLILKNIWVVNSTFESKDFHHENESPILILENGTLKNIKIEGGFYEIDFGNDKCLYEKIELYVDALSFTLKNKVVNYFIFEGFVENIDISGSSLNSGDDFIRDLYLLSSLKLYFKNLVNASKKSKWDLNVGNKIIALNTVITNTKITIYDFQTKCNDKSSLDINSSTIQDNWIELRKKYSGISFLIILTLTFLFFLPLIIKSIIIIYTSTIINSSSTKKLFEVVLFDNLSGFWGWFHFLLNIFLIIYNSLRYYCTITVSKLKEEERILLGSKFALASVPPIKIKLLIKIDRFLTFSYYLILFYSLYKLGQLMFLDVKVYK